MTTEPWRFECPRCGSVSVQRKLRKPDAHPNPRVDGYREYWICSNCGAVPKIYDKKRDVIQHAARMQPSQVP